MDFSVAVEQFDRDGYTIFRNAIEESLLSAFEEEFESAIATGVPMHTKSPAGNRLPIAELAEDDLQHARIIDVECHLQSSHELILHPVISGFLNALQTSNPTCIQTLTYKHSSQQGAHSDLYLVNPPWLGPYERNTLAASWIALEPATEENGALVIYPGSHKLQKKRLKDDFEGHYGRYEEYLRELCATNGCSQEHFHAQRGDVLMWHGDFVHAGGKTRDPDLTRFSLVSHYCSHPEELESRRGDRRRVLLPRGSLFGSGEDTSA